MSRSFKKKPIFGIAGDSEKEDKRINNRMFRRKENQVSNEIIKEIENDPIENILEKEETESKYPINMDEVRNLWDMNKDGKVYWWWAKEKDMRK